METMKKMCFKVNIEAEKGKRRSMGCIAELRGVESVAVDMKERKITVIGETDPVYLTAKLWKLGFRAELLSVGPAKQEKFEAEKGEKKVGSKCGIENRGCNDYLGVQKVGSKCGIENRGCNDYLGVQRAVAVGGFGGMNRATEVDEVSEKRIVGAVAGFGDPVHLVKKRREPKLEAELHSVGPAKQEKFEAEQAENAYIYEVGSKQDTENRGSNHYLGVQRTEAVGGFGGMNRAIEDNEGSEKRIMEAVAGFGGMNRAIEDNEGSEKRIMEAVAGFGGFTSIEVDIKKGMVTVVGKSVPVSVALKVREMGYRAKLLSLGPATEQEDPDEEDNDDDDDFYH